MPRTAGSVALFPRRAVLRIGMLLRDSPIARQVRDYLGAQSTRRCGPSHVVGDDDMGLDVLNAESRDGVPGAVEGAPAPGTANPAGRCAMTTVLDRIGDALTARPATVFFDALTAADRHIGRDDDLAWMASFAPPVIAGGSCPCGSVFEARSTQIDATDDEKLAAADAIADMLGSGPRDTHQRIVARVIDTINHERASAGHDALMEWSDNHAYCGDYL